MQVMPATMNFAGPPMAMAGAGAAANPQACGAVHGAHGLGGVAPMMPEQSHAKIIRELSMMLLTALNDKEKDDKNSIMILSSQMTQINMGMNAGASQNQMAAYMGGGGMAMTGMAVNFAA